MPASPGGWHEWVRWSISLRVLRVAARRGTYAGQMPVLGTKLRAPAPRRRLVPRERLVVRLQADPTTMPRLVLISAPAGRAVCRQPNVTAVDGVRTAVFRFRYEWGRLGADFSDDQ